MKNKLWLIPLAGGLLGGLAWYEKASGLIMLTALVPFFYVFRRSIIEKATGSLVFLRVLPGFIIFNLLTISWLRNASIAGALYAITANSFLMSSVFWIASAIYKRSSSFLGYASLLTFWIILEHINSRLSFLTPWLNLGNTLGNDISFIQWYDITGASGGTLWILLCNLSILFCISRLEEKHGFPWRQIILFLLLFIIPSGFSFLKYFTSDKIDEKSDILIIQPNIDPYSEKFSTYSFELQLRKMLKMAGNNINVGTDWIIFPETAIDDPFYEKDVSGNKYFLMIDSLLSKHKGLSLITGATTMKAFQNYDSESPEGSFLEIYNSAMHVSQGHGVSFYHKSKLVPGIEKKIRALPGFLEKKIIPDLGGTMTGYGTQDERTVFTHSDGVSRVAPVICYESVYGEFITEYIRNSANLIVIITNDGWWENTAGYKQHLIFARVRAIENRREVARAANTGISCFIDRKGKIIKQLNWWEEGSLSHSLRLNNELTFYSSNGDFISRYVSIFGVFILIITFIAAPLRSLREPQNF
ncbi:MAG TPA: apolipoprotein N-acyltransferase [Bacteroidetes bacterium]|nr:apolipoprotein N-acyltransferase [Bacteroidota bacterium]